MRSFPLILWVYLSLSGCCSHDVAFRLKYGQRPITTAKECSDGFDRCECCNTAIANVGIPISMPNANDRQECIRSVLVSGACTVAAEAKEVLFDDHGNKSHCKRNNALNVVIKKWTNCVGTLEVDYPAKQQRPPQVELPWSLLSKQKTISLVPPIAKPAKNDELQNGRLISPSRPGCTHQGSSKKRTNPQVKPEKKLRAMERPKPNDSFEEMAHTCNELPPFELPNASIKQPTLHTVSLANAKKSQEFSPPAPVPNVAARNVPSDRNDDEEYLGERQATSPSTCPLEKCTTCDDYCLSTVTIAIILVLCMVLALGFGVGIGFLIALIWPNDLEKYQHCPQSSPATRSPVEKSVTDEIMEAVMETQNRFQIEGVTHM